MWRKLTESTDLITYEKKKRDMRILIEARLEHGQWGIYKIYRKGEETQFVEEYSSQTKKQAQEIVQMLRKEKDLSTDEISAIKKFESSKVQLSIKREYKEYEVEKWRFSIGKDRAMNCMILRYADEVSADIILHEQYFRIEKKILDEISKSLKLEDYGDIQYTIYYFNRKRKVREEGKKESLFSQVELGFDPDFSQ